MQDNNYNQNNQMGGGTPVNTPVDSNVYTPTPTQMPTQTPMQPQTPVPNQNYYSYQLPPQANNTSIGVQNNAPKKKTGPLLIFGLVFLVAIVLGAVLFFEKDPEQDPSPIPENAKTLIVFFSKDGENYGRNLSTDNVKVLLEGNTAIMAKDIDGLINDDLYEIIPEVDYPDKLSELYEMTRKEKIADTYPEIKNKVENLDSYDVIFIGYPIWHTSYPQIIKTFVRDNKDVLKNKIIVPFNTHAGSGSAGTYKNLFNLIGTPTEKGLNGLAINGADVGNSDENIKNWLKSLGYKIN